MESSAENYIEGNDKNREGSMIKEASHVLPAQIVNSCWYVWIGCDGIVYVAHQTLYCSLKLIAEPTNAQSTPTFSHHPRPRTVRSHSGHALKSHHFHLLY
ncbi:hypothetical protein V6N13_145587 [Hibiscus sabdariffa]|uniref:Uncharacterized protein n=1 Tax=Hibiscus sabdariffa TaxID=183260 RepID=A0ABR2TQ16_9ROSI